MSSLCKRCYILAMVFISEFSLSKMMQCGQQFEGPSVPTLTSHSRSNLLRARSCCETNETFAKLPDDAAVLFPMGATGDVEN
jgi:hypothetical protein